MSVYEITKQVMACLKKNKYDFYAVNFANPDMVGHTGNLAATIKAIEHVDLCLKEIAKEVQKQKGTLIITADHGNAEKMIDLQTNEVWTEHTTNKVPFILVSDDKKGCRLNGGKLGNIAPTIYDLLEYKKSPKILDKSLLRNP
jgi:2,3-bisphosphoglycerate-independent phosphoglycerate mutase